MLEILTIDQKQKWDEIVESFENYDVYYLNGYTKAFYLHNDGMPMLFYYEDENGKAINVVMKRDIHDCEYFKDVIDQGVMYDMTTPYGYGGWLIENNPDLDQLFNEYDKWCFDNKIISEVIRFHPLLNNADNIRNYYDVIDLGKTIAMDLSDKDLIWANLTTQNRAKIKKAIANNVEIRHGIDEKIIQEFKKIYEITMDKDHADNYYYFDDDFYHSIFNDLSGKADIFYALYEDKIIAATIILGCNSRLTYHFSGVLTDYRNIQATNLMLYEIANWGSENGYRSFHLGGGVGSKEDNLFIFKKSFNKKDSYQYSIGRKIYNQELYDYLLSLRKGEFNHSYFPEYRGGNL